MGLVLFIGLEPVRSSSPRGTYEVWPVELLRRRRLRLRRTRARQGYRIPSATLNTRLPSNVHTLFSISLFFCWLKICDSNRPEMMVKFFPIFLCKYNSFVLYQQVDYMIFGVFEVGLL